MAPQDLAAAKVISSLSSQPQPQTQPLNLDRKNTVHVFTTKATRPLENYNTTPAAIISKAMRQIPSQPSTLTIASIAEQQTQQHIVQHHPPPVAAAITGENRIRMLQVPLNPQPTAVPQLPQSPVKQSALNATNNASSPVVTIGAGAAPRHSPNTPPGAPVSSAALRLPQSPVRQPSTQLPQVPVVGPRALLTQQPVAAAPPSASALGPPGGSVRQVIVNSSPAVAMASPNTRHIAMLPQAPTHSGLLSSVPSRLMPPSNLVPHPIGSIAVSTASAPATVVQHGGPGSSPKIFSQQGPNYQQLLANARPVTTIVNAQQSPRVQQQTVGGASINRVQFSQTLTYSGGRDRKNSTDEYDTYYLIILI